MKTGIRNKSGKLREAAAILKKKNVKGRGTRRRKKKSKKEFSLNRRWKRWIQPLHLKTNRRELLAENFSPLSGIVDYFLYQFLPRFYIFLIFMCIDIYRLLVFGRNAAGFTFSNEFHCSPCFLLRVIFWFCLLFRERRRRERWLGCWVKWKARDKMKFSLAKSNF